MYYLLYYYYLLLLYLPCREKLSHPTSMAPSLMLFRGERSLPHCRRICVIERWGFSYDLQRQWFFGTCGKIFVFFSALWFYYLWVIPSIFSPYEFETEIEGLKSMKKPYPSSYRKPHFVRTMSTKRAVVVTIWSNDFVLPALVLFRSLRLYGTYLDLVLLVPSTHVGTESLPKHFRAPELAQSNLDAFKPLGVIIKRFDPSEMYREMSLSNKVWSFQFYKLYAWTLLEYERVLMLDADTLAVTNIDDVFDACPREYGMWDQESWTNSNKQAAS